MQQVDRPSGLKCAFPGKVGWAAPKADAVRSGHEGTRLAAYSNAPCLPFAFPDRGALIAMNVSVGISVSKSAMS